MTKTSNNQSSFRGDIYFHCKMDTPIGQIILIKNEQALISISLFSDEHGEQIDHYQSVEDSSCFVVEVKQLEEYFSGTRKIFDLPIQYEGTPFQMKVWQVLQAIPYRETRSYKDIAIQIDQPKAIRAIGQANRRNHIPIIIPCHRVKGASGKLIGFGGHHTDIQQRLLQLEQSNN